MLPELLPRLSAVEEAAAELSALARRRWPPAPRRRGVAGALAAGLARLDGSIALLRESLDGLGVREETP